MSETTTAILEAPLSDSFFTHWGSGAAVPGDLRRGTFAQVAVLMRSQLFPYRAEAGAYAIVVTDYLIDCTSGTFAVTLPTAVGIQGQQFVVKNSGVGTISLDTTSGQTVDGQASGVVTLSTKDSLTLVSDGANYILI